MASPNYNENDYDDDEEGHNTSYGISDQHNVSNNNNDDGDIVGNMDPEQGGGNSGYHENLNDDSMEMGHDNHGSGSGNDKAAQEADDIPIPGAHGVVQKLGGLFGLIGVLSIIVLIQAGSQCQEKDQSCTGFLGYAVAASSISMIVCFVATVLNLSGRELSATAELWLARAMFIFWLIGVGILTFDGPFTTISNAFFAVWMCFLVSALKLRTEEKSFRAALDRAQHFSDEQPNEAAILLTSIVVFLAAIPPVTRSANGHDIYAMVASIISILWTIIFIYLGEKMGPRRSQVAVAFFVFWIVTTAVVTFGGPFRTAGNGWFASWLSVFLCFNMMR